MGADWFNMFLHENYLNFFGEIEDVATATEFLSHTDVLSQWHPNQQDTDIIGTSVFSRFKDLSHDLLHRQRTFF